MHAGSEQPVPDDNRAVQFPLRQFLLLLIPVIAVILAIAVTIANLRINAEQDRLIATERIHLRQLSGHVTADISTSLIHLRALIQETTARKIMDAPPSRILEDLQSTFLTIANLNPTYQQLRWIDETGLERVRVVRDRQRVFAVDVAALRNVGNRDYFRNARTVLPGEVYISRPDLGANGAADDPSASPVIRIATPVMDGTDRNRGVLVLNIAMRDLIETLQSVSEVTPDTAYALINPDGGWLSVAARDDADGFRHEAADSFPHAFPAIWQQMQAHPAGTAIQDDGLWIWEQLSADEVVRRVVLAESGSRIDRPAISSSDFSLVMLAHKPGHILADLHRDAYIITLFGATLLIIAYAWGLLLLLRSHVLEKQSHLAVAYANAHAHHMERLKELEERFHLLVEASSVGMVVVDAAGMILMSNSAAETMLGYGKGALTGLSVDNLLSPEQRDPHAQMRAGYLRNPEVRRMGVGRKLEALTADGRKIPVEVGLNPYLDHGKQVVLASIIEVTR